MTDREPGDAMIPLLRTHMPPHRSGIVSSSTENKTKQRSDAENIYLTLDGVASLSFFPVLSFNDIVVGDRFPFVAMVIEPEFQSFGTMVSAPLRMVNGATDQAQLAVTAPLTTHSVFQSFHLPQSAHWKCDGR